MSPSRSPLQYANTTLKPEEQHVEFLTTSSVDIISDHPEGTVLSDANQVYIFTGIGIIILCIILAIIAFIHYNKSHNIQNKPHSINGKSPVPIDSPEEYDIDIPLQKFSIGSSRLSVPSREGPKKRLPLQDIYSVSNTQNEGTNRIHTDHNNYDGEAAIVLTVIRSYSEGIYNPLQQIDDEKEIQPMSMWDIQSPDGYNTSVLATIDDIQDGDIIVDIDNMYTTLGYRRSVHNFEDAHEDPVVNGGFSDQEMEYVTPEHDEIINGDEKEHIHVSDNNNHLSAKVKKQKKRNKKNKQIKGKQRIEKRKIILTRRELAALSKVKLVKMCKMYKVPINGSKGDIVGRLLDHVYKQKMKKKKKRKK
eukprot:536818_1